MEAAHRDRTPGPARIDVHFADPNHALRSRLSLGVPASEYQDHGKQERAKKQDPSPVMNDAASVARRLAVEVIELSFAAVKIYGWSFESGSSALM